MWRKIKRETQRVGKQVEREVSRTSKRVEKEVRRTRDRVIKEAKRVSVQAEKVMHQVQERMKDPRIRALAADTAKSLIRGQLDIQSIALCVSGFIGLGTTKEEVVSNGLKKLMRIVSRENPQIDQNQQQQDNQTTQNEEGEVDLDALRDALEGLMKSMEDDVDDASFPPQMIQFRQTYRSIINIMVGDSVASAVTDSGIWLADVLDDIDNEKLVVIDEEKFNSSSQRLFQQWNTLYSLAIRLASQEKYYDSVDDFNNWPAEEKVNEISMSDMSFMSSFSMTSKKLIKSIKESLEQS